MEKHFALTDDIYHHGEIELFRIIATKDTKYAKKGELGGYIEKIENLQDEAWVFGNAMVYGNAMVFEKSAIYGNVNVFGNAKVYGNAQVSDNCVICEDAKVYENAICGGNAVINRQAEVYGSSLIVSSHIIDNAKIYGKAHITEGLIFSGNADIKSNSDYCSFIGFGSENRTTNFMKDRDGNIIVKCGCFSGSLEKFEKRVIDTHGENGHAKIYLAIIEVAKLKLKPHQQ